MKGTRWMQLSHDLARISVVFDDPNLVSCAGLAPVVALARRAGLDRLVADTVSVPGKNGANAPVKVTALVAGMVAGADSIDDMDLLRHGGMSRLFTGLRAPTTLGAFLRSFTFGHVRQLDAVAARTLAGLARCAPLLPGAGQMTYVDVDDTVRATHGYLKQGSGFGYTGVRGLNVLLGIISTPLAAPVIGGTRLRKGPANSARGAARLITDTLVTARNLGADPRCGARVLLRADTAFFTADVVAAARRARALFSIGARMSATVKRAIAGIGQDDWTAIHYPDAFEDPDTGELISDAEVAEVPVFTAFTSRPRREHVTARLIVRRVKRKNPKSVEGQGELFADSSQYRYHAIFTDSTEPMLAAEAAHRGHAIVEQVIADLKNGPLAHLPSGKFTANAAWLVLAAITFNLLRAAGCLAGTLHAKATTATLRTRLITVPARLARSARRLTLHLPADWPWQAAWQNLADTTLHAPPHAA
jgi:hypothetical protein